LVPANSRPSKPNLGSNPPAQRRTFANRFDGLTLLVPGIGIFIGYAARELEWDFFTEAQTSPRALSVSEEV